MPPGTSLPALPRTAAVAHASPLAVRSYALFGESGALPDVLHCETIAARSVLHGWELAPHRHGRLHQLLLMRAGAGLARLEAGNVPLAAGTLVNVPTGDVHAFSFTPGTQGWVLSFADELIDALLAPSPEARRALAAAAAVQLDAAATEALAATVAALQAEFDGRAAARGLLLRGLGGTVLGLAVRHFAAAGPAGTDLAGSDLLGRFEALLEDHLADHWRVADYARALAVTPTHLSRVARAATGVPASRLIDARLMREARRHLAYTTASVTAVAEALGFADPAHFSRVFSRTCGCAPRAFRASVTQAVSQAVPAAPDPTVTAPGGG